MKSSAKHHCFLVILLLLALACNQTSFAQDCDECPKINIIYYDPDVYIGQEKDSLAPLVFYWPSAVAMQNIIDNSPDCIIWTEAALANVQTLLNGSLSGLVTAPEGGKETWDYLVRGSVTYIDGIYRFSLTLETSPTLERVAGFYVQFEDNQLSAEHAGLAIAAEMNPILEKIRTFERNKRDTDTRYAIGNLHSQGEKEIIITPQKTLVNIGETIDVTIKLTDCDGVALGSRNLSFETEGGNITPEEAVTDGSGYVTVKFKAGSEPGPGKIIVWYPHLTPCGKKTDFYESELIQIDPPADNLFILRAGVNYSYSSYSDTTITIDVEGHSWDQYKSQYAKDEVNGRVIAVVENLAEDPFKDFSYFTDQADPIAITVSGSGMMNQFSKYEEVIDGKLIDADIRSDNASGGTVSGSSIQFDYTDDYKYAAIVVYIKAAGNYNGRAYDPMYGWSDYGGDYDDYGLSASAGGGPDDGCSITKSDSTSYNANYSFSENSEVANMNGTRHITINKSLTISIAPYNGLTGISEEEHGQLFPTEFSLSQNFPNPFNPVTSITFQLKSREMVKLIVFDLLGKEIAILAEGIYPQGTYSVQWDASGISGGVYFYRMQIGSKKNLIPVKKMIVLK